MIPPAAALLGLKDLVHGLAGMFLPGRYQRRLALELSAFFGVRHIFAVSSGKAALTLILRALKTLSPGRTDVLIPAYTCYSVPSAIVKAGLQVELCDIDTSTFDFDTTQLPGSITPNTLCVVPNHLFGVPSDMDSIVRAARKRGAFVVEDAAQAMGGAIRGKKLGTIGDAGFFSLGRGKNITCEAGGIILTNSDTIASAIAQEYFLLEQPGRTEELVQLVKAALLGLFIRPSLYWLPAQLSFLKLGETIFHHEFAIKRFSGLQAGLLRQWRPRLEQSNRARRENTALFCGSLGLMIGNGLPRPLLRLPVLAGSAETRSSICSLSGKQGLGISSMYPASLNRIRELGERFSGKSFPAAERVAETLFTLPTHPLLSTEDREKIIQFIKLNLQQKFILTRSHEGAERVA